MKSSTNLDASTRKVDTIHNHYNNLQYYSDVYERPRRNMGWLLEVPTPPDVSRIEDHAPPMYDR